MDICEIGGGNGKLLFCLEKKGLLKKGVNYEVSRSRCDLAERFARLLSCSRVENRNRNFLEESAEGKEFDCIIMVDIVLQLISPLYDRAEQEMMRWLGQALKKGGRLFIEIVDYSDIMACIRKNGEQKRWEEFSAPDPFQYSLHRLSMDQNGNLVVEKHFIGRDSAIRDDFKNVIRPYTPREIKELLDMNGFAASIYPFDVRDAIAGSNVYRILATKL